MGKKKKLILSLFLAMLGYVIVVGGCIIIYKTTISYENNEHVYKKDLHMAAVLLCSLLNFPPVQSNNVVACISKLRKFP